MSPTLLASSVLQAVGALITAVLFGVFARVYKKTFLSHWARSWLAMSVMLTGAVVSASMTGGAPTSAGQLTLATVTSVAAYVQIAWLLLGTDYLLNEKRAETRRRWTAWILGAAVLAGLLAVAAFANDPGQVGPRVMVRVGVRSGLMGLAFLTATVIVARSRTTEVRFGLGRLLVGLSFLTYGLTQLHRSWRILVQIAPLGEPTYDTYIGFLDFLLVFTIGLGVVIWLLEEQNVLAISNSAMVSQLAFHDPLTLLPNRRLLLDHLSMNIVQARRDKKMLAVFFFDIDRFKVINDSMGHAAGDKVLQAVAERVTATVREVDSVGRMGGDEFVIVASDIHGVSDAVHIAQKVRDSIREPIFVLGHELFVSASMGIAVYPNDGDTGATLLSNADTAMYRAKAQGSDMFQLYTPEMNAHATEQLALTSALRRAVAAREFELHYQPIVQTVDGRIVMLETMLRWRHPVLGLVRPEQFLGLAETTGLIVPIGIWALETACSQLKEWRDTGFPELRLAVNLSSRELKQSDLVERVSATLAAQSVPPSAVEFEITEASATQSEPAVIERLRRLRALGIKISIDDFGTGFSSVSVLRVFPVDTLKIDTSFVRGLVLDPNDAGIAAAVVALARSMGLQVIAEGVENPAQLDFLRNHGCEMWQGYLCCPPVVPSEVRSVLGRHPVEPTSRPPHPHDVEAAKHSGNL
jgi:diguanylate cyclase (GGDEF)-like protein